MSRKSADAKCFAAVFRLLLCSRSVPTHPSEQLPDHLPANLASLPEEKVKQATGSSPGVVARLMGLDSFPETPIWPHQDTTFGSFLRSRSVNSVDFLPHFDPAKLHRRVRSSVSFREGLYHHDAVSLLSESETVGEHEGETLRKKMEMEEEERSILLIKRKKNLHGKKKQILLQSKCMKTKQNSATVPAQVSERRERSRRSQPAQTKRPCSNRPDPRHQEAIKKATAKGKREKKTESSESCYYKRMVETICGLAEESLNENWASTDLRDLAGVCKQLGHGILEGLLKQFVHELLLLRPTLLETYQVFEF